ncbi:MAG: hypothetical protein IJO78_05970 [Erysipelotrichaceae bacterium]|nr:hypothetical protein [Erysipelotrichaceae bacterium]
MIKKIVKDQKRYIQLGKLEIPYEVEVCYDARKIKLLGFSFTYFRDVVSKEKYIKILNKRVYFHKSRRMRHYAMRDRLSLENCEKLLVKEISPHVGYTMDLKNPRTFNEKINWLKLHYHDPRVTVCADKFAVKDYAKELIGEKYIVPTIGSWNCVDEIDFESLPNQFVLKVNWSSGFNIIVKDKSSLDLKDVKLKLSSWMKESANSYYDTFNWGYKHMKPVIFAEEYIEQCDGQVYDYKFYFSKGEFIYMFIATDRADGLTYTFFDENLELLPFTYGKKPNASPIPAMPSGVQQMIALAKVLASDFPFVRVDFYETDRGKIYLGEMTFYSGGGTLKFTPQEWDLRLGRKIHIE